MKSTTLLLAVLLAGCASTAQDAAAAPAAKKTMTMRVLQQGAYAASSNERPTVLVAGDAATYERLWGVVIGGGKAPAADFTKESIVFLIDQQRYTGGYSIDPGSVVVDGNTATIRASVKRPEGGSVVAQVLTVPYAVVAVPKTKVTSARWVDAEGKLVAEHRMPGAAKQK